MLRVTKGETLGWPGLFSGASGESLLCLGYWQSCRQSCHAYSEALQTLSVAHVVSHGAAGTCFTGTGFGSKENHLPFLFLFSFGQFRPSGRDFVVLCVSCASFVVQRATHQNQWLSASTEEWSGAEILM